MITTLTTFIAQIAVHCIPPASAQVTVDPDIGTTFGLGTADLEQSAIEIVQWLLSVLALVSVVMIIVGGFRWMFSSGNEERIDSAKKTISSAIIGLIIVLLSWAIITFVVSAVTNST